jgi:hypothetical protein
MVFKILVLLFSLSLVAQENLRTNDSQQFVSGKVPRNYIRNSGAERNLANVTFPGSILTRVTSSAVLQGAASFQIDATTSAQKVVFQGEILRGVLGGNCEATFKFNGDASLYKAYVEINGVKVSAEQQLWNVTAPSRQTISINFPCGVSTTHGADIVIESTGNGAAIFVDDLYVGEATNIGDAAQATFVGSIHWAQNASCIWSWTATTSGVGSGTNANCLTPTTTGSLGVASSAPSAVINFTMTVVAGQEYLIVPEGQFLNNTTGTQILGYYFSDGTDISTGSGVWANGVASGGSIGAHRFRPTTSGLKTMALLAKANSGTINAQVYVAGNNGLRFNVYRFPTNSEQVFRVGAPGLEWTAFTGAMKGATNGLAFTNATTTGFYKCEGPTLHVMMQTNYTGTPGTGTGNFVWDLPSGFTIDTTKITTTTAYAALQGYAVFYDDSSLQRYDGSVQYFSPTQVAVLANAASTSAWSLSTPVTVAINDRAHFLFQIPVTASSPCPRVPMPLLKNAVTTTSEAVEQTVSAEVTCSAASTVVRGGTGVTIGNRSTTACTLTIASGVFSAQPWACNVTPKATAVQATACNCTSATSCVIYGPSADYNAYVQIKGPR